MRQASVYGQLVVHLAEYNGFGSIDSMTVFGSNCSNRLTWREAAIKQAQSGSATMRPPGGYCRVMHTRCISSTNE